MEKVTALWDGLVRYLEPLLDRLGALMTEAWSFFAAKSPVALDWRLAAAAALVAALLWLGLGKFGGRKATLAALAARSAKLAAAGVKQEERPCRLLRRRRHWKRLPVAFLWELCARLRDEDQVFAFVVIAERHGLQRRQLPRIARKYKTGTAMRVVAALLNGLKSRQPGDTRTASSLAMRIDGDDPRSVLKLATDCYLMACYKEALPLLVLGISLCRKLLDGQGVAAGSNAGRKGRGREAGLASAELQARLKRALEMYEDCLARVGPARA